MADTLQRLRESGPLECSECQFWAWAPEMGERVYDHHPRCSRQDVKQREPGCECHLEEGDSPCEVHGDE